MSQELEEKVARAVKRLPVHGIWLDDVRPNPDDGVCDIHVRNYSEFRAALDDISSHNETVDFISFDYYLEDFPDPNWPAPHIKTGRHCAELLIARYRHLLAPDFGYEHHSSNDRWGREITTFLRAMLSASPLGEQ